MRKLALVLALVLALSSAAHAGDWFAQGWMLCQCDVTRAGRAYIFDIKMKHYEAVDPDRGPGDFYVILRDGQGRDIWKEQARVRSKFTTHEIVTVRIAMPAVLYEQAATYALRYEPDEK